MDERVQRSIQVERAYELYQRGARADARALCESILEQLPRCGAVLQLLGVIHAQSADHARARELFELATSVEPDNALTWCFKAVTHQALGEWQAALAAYRRAIALKPDYAEAHANCGNVLAQLERWQEALQSFEHAIAASPNDAGSWCNRGNALKGLGQWHAALSSYERALAIDPACAEAHCNRGNVLQELGRWRDALASFDCAIAHQPALPEAHYNRANLLRDTWQQEAALASYDAAVGLRPHYVQAWENRAHVLLQLARHEAAAESYRRALTLKPDGDFLLGTYRHARMQICDWEGLDSDIEALAEGLSAGRAVAPPLTVLALIDSPALQREAAHIWSRHRTTRLEALPALQPPRPGERIRLGYFSADFHEHPLARLTAELFEAHDRSGFELTAFSFGPATGDAMQTRLRRAFDRFMDVRGSSEHEIALLARSLHLDIAVDLSGFTAGSRPGIFALRAAPLQLSFLGYLGTLACDYIDYLIADPVLIPPAERGAYSERLIYLPSYQPNDSRRRGADTTPGREALGLPARGFVYCCFNTSYKITPATFDVWMRILARVPESVLMLSCDSETARRKLRHEARSRGIDAARLVFARRVSYAEYLAQYRAVDLFLDTLPYNAGATASDALWAGVPVLTCPGRAFAARIAASLLTAAGMPELIAASAAAYENLAVELALDSSRLARIRARLAARRHGALLFDTPRFTAALEAAYRTIHERSVGGYPPRDVYVGEATAA